MSRELSQPIAKYFEGVNALDSDVAIVGFDGDAVVRDEGREHVELAAIHAWAQDTILRDATQVSIEDTTERGSSVGVLATLTGRFMGSPIRLRFSFHLQADRVQYLEIAS